MHQEGEPPRTASSIRRELKPAADTADGLLRRNLVTSLDLGGDMLSTLVRASREADTKAAAGGSSAACSEALSSNGGPNDGSRGSDEEIAAALEKYRSGGFLSQQVKGSSQQTATSAAENAAFLCSAVDLACLREGLHASASTLSSTRLGELEPTGVLREAQKTPTETIDGKQQLRLLGGTDLAALHTAMSDLAAAERTEFPTTGDIFKSSSSGRGVGQSEVEQNTGVSEQQDDILSSSLFTKLLRECQASGCDIADLGIGRQEKESTRVKTEAPARRPSLSSDIVALLQQQATLRVPEKPEGSKRSIESVSSTACNSSSNSRRTSSCSPGADEDGSEEAREFKRRILEMHLLDQCRSSYASSSRSSGSGGLRDIAASLSSPREGDSMETLERVIADKKQKPSGQEQGSGGDSPSNPMSPSYLAELQLIERVANGDQTVFNEDTLTASSLRGPLGYYSVCEAAIKEDSSAPRLYPIVRGVSRDNTKKRWAVYWKGYRRYFYDKFFESCVEAYRRAVQFRQQATTAAAAVAATGNPAHLIAAGLHGSSGGSSSNRQQVKGDSSEAVAAVLASAAAAVASQASGDSRKAKAGPQVPGAVSCRDRSQDSDRAVVCLYKEAILFVLEDLRNNVLAQYLTSRAAATVNATANTVPHAATVELAAATTAKRLLDQLLLVHTNLVGNATSTAELQPSLMIVAPCLEDLKLPSQQTTQQQLQLLQSILAMHIQQLLLLSRYLSKGSLVCGDTESRARKQELVSVKEESGQNNGHPAAGQEEAQVATALSSTGAVDVHA